MEDNRWYTADDGTFAVRLPAGWQVENDEEDGGVDFWHPDGAGELHLLSFAYPAAEPADPGEELFAFLAESDVELEEDEVEDMELEGGAELAVCEYLTEDEESGDVDYWRVGVAAFPGTLVFAHYTCAAGEEEREREQIDAILRTLRQPGPA